MPPSESDARSLGPPAPDLVAAPSLGVHGDLDPPLLAEAPSTPLPQGGHSAQHHPSRDEPNGDGDPDLPSGDGNYRCGGE